MAMWGQFGLQDGLRVPIELIVMFHDYIIVYLIGILFLVSSIRYRILSNPGLDKNLSESHLLEFIWTVFPMVILLLIAFPSLYLLYLTEDTVVSGCMIKVIGHQWYWEYQYSSGLGSQFLGSEYNSYIINDDGSQPSLFRNLDVDNRVVVPTGLSTLMIITSADVLHSWAVPSLGVKADAVPGRLNYVTLSPTRCGVYYGQCSELCGRNHSFMPIVVESVQVSDFVVRLTNLAEL